MGCRIGMATDVPARVRQLKSRGAVPEWAAYLILESGLTYEEANERERALRTDCGFQCEGAAGGGYKTGPAWSVYRIDW